MPRTVHSFEKYAREVLNHTVDFSDILGAGESISSRALTATDEVGNDTSAELITNISGSGSLITYTLSGGIPGKSYTIDVEATLNTGEVHVQRLYMNVIFSL